MRTKKTGEYVAKPKHQPRCHYCDAPYSKIMTVKGKIHFVCEEHSA